MSQPTGAGRAGFAAVGLWLVEPSLALRATPVLVCLACPLSMLFTNRRERGGACSTASGRAEPATTPEIAELRAEIAQLRAEHAHRLAEPALPDRPPVGMSA